MQWNQRWLALAGALVVVSSVCGVQAAAVPAAAATSSPVQVWMGPTVLATDVSRSMTSLVASGSGPLTVADLEQTTSDLVYRTRTATGWSSPTLIAHDVGASSAPAHALAIDPTGAVHSVVSSNDENFVSRLTYREQRGGPPQHMFDLGPGFEPDLTTADDGTTAVVAVTYGQGIQAWTIAPGAAVAPAPVVLEQPQQAAGITSATPVLSGDGAGGFIAVWVRQIETGTQQLSELRWARFSAGAWSAADTIPGTPLDEGQDNVGIGSSQTQAVLAWGSGHPGAGSTHAMTFTNGTWSPPQLVAQEGNSGAGSEAIDVAVGGTGQASILSPFIDTLHTRAAGTTTWVAGPPMPQPPDATGCDDARLGLDGSTLVAFQSYQPVEADVCVLGEYRMGMPATSRLVPVVPARVLDTRAGQQSGYSGGKPVAGETLTLQVAGRGGVPATGVSAVVLNVVATGSDGNGFVTVWPAGAPQPLASNLNVQLPGQTVANQVIVPVSPTGAVQVFTSVGTELVADVDGYYAPASSSRAGRFVALSPSRILETRPGSQSGYAGEKPVAGQTLELQVTGRGGVPATGVSTVVMNVTATQTQSGGYLSVWPSGSAQPLASSLNYERAGETVPNHVLVPVGPDGKVLLYSSTGTHLIADVAGYFTDATAPDTTTGLFVPVTPTRMFDTRYGSALFAGEGREFVIAGAGPIPSNDTAAVVLNVTATRPAGTGYATVWQAVTARPTASNLNFEFAGQTRPNLVTVATTAWTAIFADAGSDFIGDVAGYYTSQ